MKNTSQIIFIILLGLIGISIYVNWWNQDKLKQIVREVETPRINGIVESVEYVEYVTRGHFRVAIRSLEQKPLFIVDMKNYNDFFSNYKISAGDSVTKKNNSLTFIFYRKIEKDSLVYSYKY